MLARERHLHRLLEGLDIPEAQCEICGEPDSDALTRMPRSLLDRHHIGGAAQGGPEVIACQNAHMIFRLAQAPQMHLLRRKALPPEVQDALYLLDEAAVQKRLAREKRRRAYAMLERFARTPEGRRLLRHPRSKEASP
jgi:hypothetical protein